MCLQTYECPRVQQQRLSSHSSNTRDQSQEVARTETVLPALRLLSSCGKLVHSSIPPGSLSGTARLFCAGGIDREQSRAGQETAAGSAEEGGMEG